MRGRRCSFALVAGVVCVALAPLSAVEIQRRDREGADQANATDLGWSSSGRLGLFAANVATANADTSRDTEVNSGPASARFLGTGDATLWYRLDHIDELEQNAEIRYGRTKTADAEWTETTDVIDYTAVGRHRYRPRRAGYVALVLNTSFTGPDPRNDAFDPIRGAGSAGHSWLFEDLQPLSDRLEVRLGVRAQKRWGTGLPDYARKIEVGPETYLRYQRKQTNELSWWAQIEAFTEFSDFAHVQGLSTAGLTLNLSKPVTIDLRLRAYYERHPNDLPAGESGIGYDQLGMRQETLLGISVAW